VVFATSRYPSVTRKRPRELFVINLMQRSLAVCLLAGVLVGLPLLAHAQIALTPFITSGLTAPLELVQDPTDRTVQFVVQQNGVIKVIKDGVLLDRPFLDVSADVRYDQGEEGLLSMAFAPDTATSRRFFVYFNGKQGVGDCVLARFTRSAGDPLIADPASRFDVEWSPGHRYLQQPTDHHKGGRMFFGPTDGYLYIALGDGGDPDNPDKLPQNPASLLGKMLRIDVNVDDADPKGYRVPSDNPFADGHLPGALAEIWDFGFRNPWRWSFDDPRRGGTGAIIIGDVGQSSYEEINYEPAGQGGRNYGWGIREGTHPYPPDATQVPAFQPLTDPIYDYGRSIGGCVIAGYIYRGSALDESFRGRYIYADFLTRHLFSFVPTIDPTTHEAAPLDISNVIDHTAAVGGEGIVGPVTSIDLDAEGELYLVRHDGKIYKLVASSENSDADNDGLPDNWERQFGLDPSTGTGDNGADGDPDGDGSTNIQEYRNGTHPRGVPALTRYFAEGSNSDFFDTTIDLANPGSEDAAVLLRFLKYDGSIIPYFVKVPAQRHVTVATSTIEGVHAGDFSTVIETDHEIVAERTMVWSAAERYGSHSEVSINTPATVWFLAEGATHGAFDVFYLIENANDTAAEIEVTYLLPAPKPPVVIDYSVSAHSRRTIWVDDEPGLDATDVSAIVRSINARPVIVERAMYFSSRGIAFVGGHDSAGVTAPSRRWFFAEGATGSFFDMFLLLANPDPTLTAHVTMSYLLTDGTAIYVTHDLAPNSRQTYNVQGEHPLLASAAVSTIVDSDVPIVAERSMYWPKPASEWTEAHNSPGATSTGTLWAVAGGDAGGPFNAQTYVLVANTSPFAGKARVTVLQENGEPLTRDFSLPPNSRTNVPIGDTPEFAAVINSRFGVVVESLGDQPAQIVVERATYSDDAHGTTWAAGAAALATKLR
jgi:glucose/arabinose dehydrogenase